MTKAIKGEIIVKLAVMNALNVCVMFGIGSHLYEDVSYNQEYVYS